MDAMLESTITCPGCGFSRAETDADRRLPLVLGVSRLRRAGAAEAGRLLCLLLLRHRALSPGAGVGPGRVLWLIGCEVRP